MVDLAKELLFTNFFQRLTWVAIVLLLSNALGYRRRVRAILAIISFFCIDLMIIVWAAWYEIRSKE